MSRIRRFDRALVRRFIFELLVVFIGVYAAFALQNHQSDRQRARQAAVLRERIAMDLDRIAQEGAAVNEEMDLLRSYLDAITSGQRPPLMPFTGFIPYTPEVWDAVLASGGLELLETSEVMALSTFYGRTKAILREIQGMEEYGRALLLPNLDKPSEEFYDEEGRIRQKYMWFANGLWRLVNEMPVIVKEADSLAVDLRVRSR